MQKYWFIFLCYLPSLIYPSLNDDTTNPFILISKKHPRRYRKPVDNRPYVTSNLQGQLGNQLFQIATALAYAWDFDAIPVFPDLNRHDFRLSYHRDRIFFRLSAKTPSRLFIKTFNESSWDSPTRIPNYNADIQLNGYFSSWAHFDHYRQRILEKFAPSDAIEDYLQAKYGDLISHPNTVSLHVRTFNYMIHHTKTHPFLGLEYYQMAIQLFPPDTIFVIFSDRINWCKQHFPQLNNNFVFIEGNDAVADLFLMSMMKHHIIANSTFSWWGAYLNHNPHKIIVAPKSWHHPDLGIAPEPQPNQFYFDDWIVLSPNYDEPYPEDMTWYDHTTQSLDGN